MSWKRVGVACLAFFLLFFSFGCTQAGGNENQQGNVVVKKIFFTAPEELPVGKVGVPYEYSYCLPKPAGFTDSCGGVSATVNPTGGKGPYAFYLGSGKGFPHFGLNLGVNGILSGIPTAAGKREFGVCVKDVAGDFACDETSLTVVEEELSLDGEWELESILLMNGPEGSFPAGCSMTQQMIFKLTQNKGKVSGTATNKLMKTSECGIWTVELNTPTVTPLTGTIAGSSFKISMGSTDFEGTIEANELNGIERTCRSPDVRCTTTTGQQLNWYEGEFTAKKK